MNCARLFVLISSIIIFILTIRDANSDHHYPQYPHFPEERSGHTAFLIANKLYFLGGKNKFAQRTNDFFYLDVSKSFLTSNLSFHDLSYLSITLPPHQRGTASLCGNTSIYFFGGERDLSNKPDSLIYTFNAVSQQWSHPKINGNEPNIRKQLSSTCDSKGQMYLYAGLSDANMGLPLKIYNDINILDTVNLIWNTSDKSVSDFTPEFINGFSATMLKDGIIVYIGGWNNEGYHDMTKDDRILIWGGENGGLPAKPQLAVLDTHFKWSIPVITGVKNSIEILPYYAHTTTMIDDYMVIAFGLTYDKLHNTEIPSNLIFLLYTPNQDHYEWTFTFIPSDNFLTNFGVPQPPPISSPDDPIDQPAFALDALIVVLFLVGALIGFIAWYLYKYHPEIRRRAGYSLLPTNDFWAREFWGAD
ncbi:34032_t:CDS:2 [Gigaspora margarita]|uniref:34032_t:CDS:1 n=1 Tax=Gigaspora margarita TaxID=4874 RepID=A0ABN7ULF1_GIGMA|nr:34032_t:CDS:2 [Gigaspora margarita]